MHRKTTTVDSLTIEWLGHSTIGIYGKKILYIDPFSQVLKGDEEKADLIVSTHSHRDHFDVQAINSLSKNTTSVIIKSGCNTSDLKTTSIRELDIDEVFKLDDMGIKGVHAYNTRRFRSPGVPFHPEGFGMGVILTVEGVKFYYAGDTDFIPPMEKLRDEKISVAFLPIGGTYTMDVDEAVEAALTIGSEIIIPVHYNLIEGTKADPSEFKAKVEAKAGSKVVILGENQ
jgi:L-ascorbate metabolism protein UlaG (beta-lactamase superfamily)